MENGSIDSPPHYRFDAFSTVHTKTLGNYRVAGCKISLNSMRMLQTYAPALFCNSLSSYAIIAFSLMRFRSFRPSTLIRYVCVFVSIHLHFERLQIDAFSMKTLSV